MSFEKRGRPPEDRLARQGEIYAAVAPLILSVGARKLSMRDAAHAACMSVGGLYHYFPTKRDLLLHGLSFDARERLCRENRSALGQISALDLGEYLEIYIDHTLTMWEFVHPSVQAAMQLGYDEFQQQLDDGFTASVDELAEALRLLAPELTSDHLAALGRAIRRLALGAVVDRDFDRDATRPVLRAILQGVANPGVVSTATNPPPSIVAM